MYRKGLHILIVSNILPYPNTTAPEHQIHRATHYTGYTCVKTVIPEVNITHFYNLNFTKVYPLSTSS
jgi:hypothetical protein